MSRTDEFSVNQNATLERATNGAATLSDALARAIGDVESQIAATLDRRENWRQALIDLRESSQKEIERLQTQIQQIDALLRRVERDESPAAREPKVIVLDDEGKVQAGPPVADWTDADLRVAAQGEFGVENESSPGWFSAGRPNTWLNEAAYVQLLKRIVPFLRSRR